MSFNMTWVLADLSYTPSQGDLESVVEFLHQEGIIGEPIDAGSPVMGQEYHWNTGPNASLAVEGQGYRPGFNADSQVTLYMNDKPTQIGDESGSTFKTRFYLLFYEGAEARNEFVARLANALGAKLFDWIGHY